MTKLKSVDDAEGTEYLLGYGQQMHPAYGTFRRGREEDILELVKQESQNDH